MATGAAASEVTIYGFAIIQGAGIIASLSFMWTVRHTKTE
jgi:hypothetical protein